MLEPDDPLELMARPYRNSELSLGDAELLQDAIEKIDHVWWDLKDFGLQPQRLNRVADLLAELDTAFDDVLRVLDPLTYDENKRGVDGDEPC
jgi:hypothetical protein